MRQSYAVKTAHKKTSPKKEEAFAKSRFTYTLLWYTLTVLFKSCDQVVRNHLCRAAFDLVPFNNMYKFAILK